MLDEGKTFGAVAREVDLTASALRLLGRACAGVHPALGVDCLPFSQTRSLRHQEVAAGEILWFIWKKFVGSYFAFSSRRRL